MNKKKTVLKWIAAGTFFLFAVPCFSQTLASYSVDTVAAAQNGPAVTPVLAAQSVDPGKPGETPRETPKLAASSQENTNGTAMPPGGTSPPNMQKPKEEN